MTLQTTSPSAVLTSISPEAPSLQQTSNAPLLSQINFLDNPPKHHFKRIYLLA